MSKVRVLACDGIHADGLAQLRAAGYDVKESAALKSDELSSALAGVDVLLVRSATKVDAASLGAADALKVIGRAGAGVDTIDVDAATSRGIAVMNAPDGNTLAAAEQALALLFAVARHTPFADTRMKAGEWPKGNLTGFEMEGKRLAVVGLGRIGSTVARKARGLGMEVAAYDPHLPPSAAQRLDIALRPLEDLLAWCDIVTLHMPLTDETRNVLSEARMRSMRRGAVVINAARGGLVDEAALIKLLDEGHLAAAGLDVFETEPLPADSALRQCKKLVLTPHLGASTGEAQRAVSTILAKQVVDYLENGTVSGCVNLPPLPPEMVQELGPLMPLMRALGRLSARLVAAPTRVSVSYAGRFEGVDTRPLTRLFLAEFLSQTTRSITPVNALDAAAARGLQVSETIGGAADGFDRLVCVSIDSERVHRQIEATLHRGPRVVRLDGVEIEFDPRAHLLLLRNVDRPGMIGLIGTHLGVAGVNIINFTLGSTGEGHALAAITVDRHIDDALVTALRGVSGVIELERV
ncbi:MAG: phosphoglycerate dehydrogenase [Acidobacteriota bacterium]